MIPVMAPIVPPPRSDRPLTTLQRVLSKAGLASRTQACRWIAARRMRVNDVVIVDPDHWVDPAVDRITLDGRPVRTVAPAHFVVHKPCGYVTTRRDKLGRPTVFELLPRDAPYVFNVGRLDLDSSGLLILTNDSVLTERLTNPRHEVSKTYRIETAVPLDDRALEALRRGVELDDGPTRPAVVERADHGVTVTITEGRNRQVRRMIRAIGTEVVRLERIAIGPLTLAGLPEGGCRALTAEELDALRTAAGITPAARRTP